MTTKGQHKEDFYSGGTVPDPDCGIGYMNLYILKYSIHMKIQIYCVCICT